MEIIDAHAHIWTSINGERSGFARCRADRYGKARVWSTDPNRDVPGFRTDKWAFGREVIERWIPPSFIHSVVDPEVLIEYMNWIGVDRAILMQAPTYGNQNEYIREVLDKFPDRFIAGPALVDPGQETGKMIEDLEYAVGELGLKGVKFETPDSLIWLDDERYNDFWRKMVELDAVLSVDLGWDIESPYTFQIDRLETLLRRFPEMRTIVVHLGGSNLLDPKQEYPFPDLQKTLKLAEYDKLWFELASIVHMGAGEEYPFPRVQKIIQTTYETVGPRKIIWGSDFPTSLDICTYQQTLNLVARQCDFIARDDLEWILGKNARAAFKLD